MHYRRFLLHTAVFVLTSFSFSIGAWADISGTVWRVHGNLGDAGPNSIAGVGVVQLGTFTASGINFTTNNNVGTLDGFLNSGGATYSSMTDGTELMSDKSTYSTVIEILGSGTFLKGGDYSITHDDGAILCVNDPTCAAPVLNSPAPTSAETSTWTPGSDVTGNYVIWYMGTNGNPEVLQTSASFPTPEPGAVPLTLAMLAGVAGMATLLRKKKLA